MKSWRDIGLQTATREGMERNQRRSSGGRSTMNCGP